MLHPRPTFEQSLGTFSLLLLAWALTPTYYRCYRDELVKAQPRRRFEVPLRCLSRILSARPLHSSAFFLLHSSSQRTLIYIVDALRAPRGGFPFSTSGGVDSLQSILSLSFSPSRHSVLHSRCRSLSPSLSPPNSRFSSIPVIPNPPTLCHLPFSLSPLRPCRYSISPVPVFDSRSRSRFCSSRRHPHQLHHPHPPPACSRLENIPRRW